MKSTPDLLEAHLKCPTKGWLCAVAAPPTGNEYADWVKPKPRLTVPLQPKGCWRKRHPRIAPSP